jgi:hypothetical protein
MLAKLGEEMKVKSEEINSLKKEVRRQDTLVQDLKWRMEKKDETIEDLRTKLPLEKIITSPLRSQTRLFYSPEPSSPKHVHDPEDLVRLRERIQIIEEENRVKAKHIQILNQTLETSSSKYPLSSPYSTSRSLFSSQLGKYLDFMRVVTSQIKTLKVSSNITNKSSGNSGNECQL